MNYKTIIVPKDKIAEKSLDTNEAQPSQLIELTISEEDFKELFSLGVFELINTSAKSNIDEYEDEFIDGEENMKNVINVLHKEELNTKTSLKDKISEIRELFEEALSRQTGVYFYF